MSNTSEDLIDKYLENTAKNNNKPGVTSRNWYLPNRAGYIESIQNIFEIYELKKQDDGNTDLDSSESKLKLFSQQKFVRDYMQNKSPYNGLLLYHGLGVGKTRASIEIAELLSTKKEITIMLPANIRNNYINEILKFGNKYYSTDQHWKFIDIVLLKDFKDISNIIIDQKIIKKNKGLWYSIKGKESNYDNLTQQSKNQIINQIKSIIEKKYNIINYDGITKSVKLLNELTKNNTINPFDNNVVIIDEVHNFISMVINAKKETISSKIYRYLSYAKNCKLVLLSGTPIINKPFEIVYLINLMKKNMKIYNIKPLEKIDEDDINNILEILNINKYIDSTKYNARNNKFEIQLNPYNFIRSKNNKVKYNENNLENEEMLKLIIKELKDNNYKFEISRKKNQELDYSLYEYLPMDEEEFEKKFVDKVNNTAKNENLFMRRSLGCVSYFEYEKSDLFPDIIDEGPTKVDMSDYVKNKYVKVRTSEISREKLRRMDNDDDSTQTYKTFSRAICNFAFPDEIERPYASDLRSSVIGLDEIDEENKKILNDEVEKDDKENAKRKEKDLKKITEEKLKEALDKLEKNEKKYLVDDLEEYSPKFKKILENINNSPGSTLIYSQFRTTEGLGILKLVFKANGYAEFKIKKSKTGYELDMKEEDYNKPKFAEFTGDKEKNDILLSVFNNNFNNLPDKIKKKLDKLHSSKKKQSDGNLRGSIIKILMITKSGSEGISLKNVRQVHIVEPYWNKIRMDQVIGRAARTKSHMDLPKNERFINVYKYLSVFSEKQLEDKKLENFDNGLTTDEVIYNIAIRKNKINSKFLSLLKSSAVDCSLYKKNHPQVKKCFSFPINIDPDQLIIEYNINDEDTDKIRNLTERTFELKLNNVKILDKNYMILFDSGKNDEGQLFDYEQYNKFETPVFVGLLYKNIKNQYVLKLVKE